MPRVACSAAAPSLLFVRNNELVSRLGATLLLICLARLGHFIPIPGAPLEAISSRIALELLLGRSEVSANIFALGIAPLMSAYFVLAAANIVPEFRKHFAVLREQGPQGREIYQAYASGLFVLVAFWEGFVTVHGWLQLHAHIGTDQAAEAALSGSVLEAVQSSSGAWVLWAVLMLAAGSTVSKFVTQMVEQHGLGDGTGLVIALGVAVNYAHFIANAAVQLASSSPASPASPLAGFVVVALCTGLVAVSIWAQSVELRLPITFYRTRHSTVQSQHPLLTLVSNEEGQLPATQSAPAPSRAGHAMGQYFPMRLSPSGARSLLFASFWAALLQAPLGWLGLANPFESALGFAALVLITEAVTLTDLTPRQVSRFLAGNNAGLHGLSPGDETNSFIAVRRQQLKLLNAALLASLSLAARGVDAASQALIGVPVGCLSLLLLASTVTSAARQVEALCRTPVVQGLLDEERR